MKRFSPLVAVVAMATAGILATTDAASAETGAEGTDVVIVAGLATRGDEVPCIPSPSTPPQNSDEPCFLPGPGPAFKPPGWETFGFNCTQYAKPTTEDYLSGRQCPPREFPYVPTLVDTRKGQRALDPYDDGCSGPLITEDQIHFDFNQACATHDYGYDLVRWGGTPLREGDVDGFFKKDLKMSCEGRRLPLKLACLSTAEGYGFGVKAGTPRPDDGQFRYQDRRLDVEEISPYR